MRAIFSGKLQMFLQAVLFFAVLNALLFSCGEGVRLFPFPALNAAQNEQSSLTIAGKFGFSEYVFRYEKGESNTLSKIKRGAKEFLAENFISQQDAPVFNAAARQQADLPQNSAVFKSQSISRSRGSRAPPFS